MRCKQDIDIDEIQAGDPTNTRQGRAGAEAGRGRAGAGGRVASDEMIILFPSIQRQRRQFLL